jgi:phage tail-like protein
MRMYNLMKKLSRFVVVMLAMAMIFMIVAAPSSALLPFGKIAVDVGPGYCEGIFQEFSGISTNNDVIIAKTPSKGTISTQYIPGALTTSKLVLKRDATDDMGFYSWRKLVEDGKVSNARKNVSINLINANGAVVARWNLVNAWPCSISYDYSNSVLTETITLAYEGVERQK